MSQKLVDIDPFRLALDQVGADRGRREPDRELRSRRRTYQDRNFGVRVDLLAECLKALGGVHGVADDGVVDAAWRPDVADDKRAGVDADTQSDTTL